MGYDLLGIAGLVALGVGLWWLSPAWCLVIIGSLVFALGASGAGNARRDAERRKARLQVDERIKRMKTYGPAAEEFDDDES